MDNIIAGYPAFYFGDLMLCEDVAYQADMTVTAQYDESYYNKCHSYEGQEIAKALNYGRVSMVGNHYGDGPVLDVGVGSGEFIKNRPNTCGYDVNSKAVEWLKSEGYWREDFESFRAFTFWDVIEHVPEPDCYLSRVPVNSYVFVSIPIFNDLSEVPKSKHYRPGEHLYYFTRHGFIRWMEKKGFDCLEVSQFESQAGRESIESFAFVKL